METGTHSMERLSRPPLFFAAMLLFLLSACSSQQGQSSVNNTPEPTSTLVGTVSLATPALTEKYEFTEHDSQKTVTYVMTTRFTIILNAQMYPKEKLLVSCNPAGTLGSISNIPSETPPLYAVRYEGIQPGLCTISNGTFLLTVNIIALSSMRDTSNLKS